MDQAFAVSHVETVCDLGRDAHGLGLAREWMLRISAMGLPCASELLDPLAAPYFADLLTWGGIGARTAESQPHRELASGFPAPVGFKNGTQGDLQGALDAVVAARAPQSAIGLDARGQQRRGGQRGGGRWFGPRPGHAPDAAVDVIASRIASTR